jgi:hypothetical protein
MTQCDRLANLAAIDDAGPKSSAFYPNFAGFRQSRAQPAAVRLLADGSMRATIFHGDDDRLADAFRAIRRVAESEGGGTTAGTTPPLVSSSRHTPTTRRRSVKEYERAIVNRSLESALPEVVALAAPVETGAVRR